MAMCEMTRGGFLKCICAGAAAAAQGSMAASQSTEIAPCRLCVFSDLHYDEFWTNSDDTSFLDAIMERAVAERCDFMIHLGDFMHGVKKPHQRVCVEKYNASRIPAYHVLGNHDMDQNPEKATLDAYRMEGKGYYSFDRNGFRFVVVDPNYLKEGSRYIHFQGHNHGKVHGVGLVPPEQLAWLRSVVVGSPLPCVVMAHESFERGNYMPVSNAAEVRAVFNEANERNPGTVRLVMNGHNHNDHLRVLDNILYFDVNSANYQWFGKKHGNYPADYVKRHPGCIYTLGWTRPLSATVTLWPG